MTNPLNIQFIKLSVLIIEVDNIKQHRTIIVILNKLLFNIPLIVSAK